MEREVVFEEKNLRLEYSENGNYLCLIWGLHTPEPYFKSKIDEIMKISEERNVSGFYVDTVNNKGISPGSQEYAARKVEEYANKRELFKQAFVVPPDIFSKFSVESYSKKVQDYSGNVVLQFFDSETAACAWLEEN